MAGILDEVDFPINCDTCGDFQLFFIVQPSINSLSGIDVNE